MLNYDESDYEDERSEFIQASQQKIWDLWVERYQRTGWMLTDDLRKQITSIVEDWSGHFLQIEVSLPAKTPEDDIPF